MKVLDFHKKDLLVEYRNDTDVIGDTSIKTIVGSIKTITGWGVYGISEIASGGESCLRLEIPGVVLFYDGNWKDGSDRPASVTIL